MLRGATAGTLLQGGRLGSDSLVFGWHGVMIQLLLAVTAHWQGFQEISGVKL